jgi:quercetin dioxygenase-like cupin family protein
MRKPTGIVIAMLLASCGAAAPAASSPSATATASPSAAAVVATPTATYSPKAEGFDSKKLVEEKRTLAASLPGIVWIVPGDSRGGTVRTAVADKGSFTASYQVPIDRAAADVKTAIYVTPDLPPLPAGAYAESLTLVTVQPGGRSAAHIHSGIEGVLVLDGQVRVRTAGHAPADLKAEQGFYILPQTPIQLINIGSTVARTLVYSISPEGAPFSTPLDQAP